MAAVHRAHIAHQKQHAVGVAVRDAFDGAVLVFVQRIAQFARMCFEFTGRWKRLFENRIVVCFVDIDQGQIIRCDRDGEFADGLFDLCPFGRLKLNAEQILDRLNVANGVAKLPFPVTPVIWYPVFVNTVKQFLLAFA